MYYIYFLYSKSHNKNYIGFTHDVHKRLLQHNSNDNLHSFTSKFKPWELIAYFCVGDSKHNAMTIEQFIKKQKSKKFNQRIIASVNNKSFIDKLISDILSKDC